MEINLVKRELEIIKGEICRNSCPFIMHQTNIHIISGYRTRYFPCPHFKRRKKTGDLVRTPLQKTLGLSLLLLLFPKITNSMVFEKITVGIIIGPHITNTKNCLWLVLLFLHGKMYGLKYFPGK